MLAGHGAHAEDVPIAGRIDREQLGPPIAVGELILTPVERVTLVCRELDGRVVGFGEKRAVAVIVRSPEGETRLDLTR